MVIGALFDPKDFASGEGVTTEAGFAAGLAGVLVGVDLAEPLVAAAAFGSALADVFVCVRAETLELAASAKTKIKIPVRLRNGFTCCSPKDSRFGYSNPIWCALHLIDVKPIQIVIPKAKYLLYCDAAAAKASLSESRLKKWNGNLPMGATERHSGEWLSRRSEAVGTRHS